MPKQPIDLGAVRQLDAQLAALLEAHPELKEPSHERDAALAEWLKTLDVEEPMP